MEGWRLALFKIQKSTLSQVGVGIILAVVLMAILAPWIAPHPKDAGKMVHFESAFEPPSLRHPFGTDDTGRDILSRVIFGSRISLMLGGIVLAIAIGVGVPLGLIAGYLGGRTNAVIMRVADVFLSVPPLALAIVVGASLGPTLENSIMAVSFVWWPWYVRIVQGEVLSIKEEQFVEVSRSLGANWVRIAFREVLPNCIAPITVKGTLDMGFAILVGAALSFLGLGAQEPTPDWGTIVSVGRQHLPGAWWITTFPGLAIFVTVLGFNLLGDGLRDLLDVRTEKFGR